MFDDRSVLTAITDDVVRFCAENGDLIDGRQIDQIALPHGVLTKTPRRGAQGRSLHLRRREEVLRHLRRELAARNLRLDLKARQTKLRDALYVLHDAVDGSIEQLRSEGAVPGRRARRAIRRFTTAVDRSPRFDLPREVQQRLENDTMATVADITRVLQRSYDQVVDITVAMGSRRQEPELPAPDLGD